MSYIGTNGGNKTLAQALANWKYEYVPQVGLHTTEFPSGHTLLALWQFINTRDTHGSYHAGSDAHGASNQYCPWSWGAWGAPSINRWAAHVSGNCRSAEWDTMPAEWRRNIIHGMAKQAHRYSRWCVSIGKGPVPPRRITKEQALRRVYGHVYHGSLQADRTDPGAEFDWDEYITEFKRLEKGGLSPAVAMPMKENPMTLEAKTIRSIADAVWNDKQHDLNGNGNSKSFAVQNTNDQVNHLRKDVAALRGALKGLVEKLDETHSGLAEHVTAETDRAVAEIVETKEA